MPRTLHAKSTTADVLEGRSLAGCRTVITGATGGIGQATAAAMARAGADVIIGGRKRAAVDATAAALGVRGLDLDLMAFDSIERFAQRLLADGIPVRHLILNAGITAPLQRNAEGIESQLMTNFIGHALLTVRLMPLLLRAGGARVVALTSFGHHYSTVILDDLNFERRPYSAWDGYGQSKTACVLLAVKVAREVGALGVDAFAVHPGAIMTTLGSGLGPEDFALAAERGSIPREDDWKTPDQGSSTTVWAATASELAGRGPLYLEDCREAEILDVPNYRSGVMRYALDPDTADRLWAATERLIGRRLALTPG
ncbi:MAG TPA: SDR family NAD(P)-dependent oxidoreductase [Nevskiaceae bacterium]|nr:SDR family NAD(P)-dependent oxidoreductase [Nevskiaceae bacterium]